MSKVYGHGRLRTSLVCVALIVLVGCAQDGSRSGVSATKTPHAQLSNADDRVRPGDDATSPGSTTADSGDQRVGDDAIRGADAGAANAPLPEGTVTPQEAADWLTYPILSFTSRVDAVGGREFAEYAPRTASPNPRDGALVHVIWQPRAFEYSLDDEIRRGGLHLQLRVMGPQEATEVRRDPYQEVRHTYKEITVRGHSALLQEGYENQEEIDRRGDEPWRLKSNENNRRIIWTSDLDGGRWAQWIVTSNPLLHSEEESITIVNQMDELLPR